MSTIPSVRPDVGIDTIARPDQGSGHGDVSERPGRSLPESPRAPTVEAWHEQAGLDGYMTLQFRPSGLAPDQLAPVRFAASLEQAQHDLKDAALQHPDHAVVLHRADRVLGDEMDLRGLMTMYRSALLQG